MRQPRFYYGVIWILAIGAAPLLGADPEAAERGRKALLEKAYIPATMTLQSYDAVWRIWDPKSKEPPANYDQAFRERYGLNPAAYPNGKYPMGVREGTSLLGRGLTTDCLICHGGSICGKSYVGLGNASLDFQAFAEEMSKAKGGAGKLPFHFTNVRGTSEAGAMSVFLLSYRDSDLNLRLKPEVLNLKDDLCEDPPAWWLLKKKATMYHTGGVSARSARSLMQFMMSPLNPRSVFDREEAAFRDIQAYLLSLSPPKYPFAIDADLAKEGRGLFNQTCSRCHGTYGDHPTYPNKIIPLAEIGTDPNRYHGISEKFTEAYNASWFAHEKRGWLGDEFKGRITAGYQAPPLDGIWATAPYFHNGSAPTAYHVLNSRARPAIFTRSYRTDEADYDPVRLGWKITVRDKGANASMPAIEQRKIYDTNLPGRSNKGHTFGDGLTEKERMAIIEYLKTL